jgi:threonine synthase
MLSSYVARLLSMATAFLQCIEPACRKRQLLETREYRCEACGGLLDVEYEMAAPDRAGLLALWQKRKSGASIEDRSGVWRFRDLLPFVSEGAGVVTLSEGNTPLVEAPRAAKWAGGVRLTVKHQGANPTGSFKDLGMTACVTQAAILGCGVVACASTGNTSASMSAYAIRAGMKALVFVPGGKIAMAKLAQALEFGATVIEIGGNFDRAVELLRALVPELKLYLVNSLNPFRLEGQKTIILELLEQRGWRVPDYIFVPGGNLGNVSAMAKGLCELRRWGFIEKLPRLVVTQAEGANPFCRMLTAGAAELTPIAEPHTEATAIRIGNPVNWKKALRAIRATEGLCASLSDDETFDAKAALAKDGIGCEPASATTVAGIRKLRAAGKIEIGADVVAVLTGNQLKDPESGLRRLAVAELARRRISVEADAGKLRAALASLL